jgi:hypothetical protein
MLFEELTSLFGKIVILTGHGPRERQTDAQEKRHQVTNDRHSLSLSSHGHALL